MDPRVSIGLPVFNGEKYLQGALDSILAQTYRDFELVISDNGSTDATERICRDYAARDRRIRYHRLGKNIGLVGNFERVFKESRGEYFRWAAADDIIAPENVQRCLDVMDRYADVVLCYPKARIIDEHGHVINQYDSHLDALDLRFDSPKERFAGFHNGVGLCNAIYGLIRRAVLEKTSRITRHIGSDVLLLSELTLYGKIYEIPDYLFFLRIHPESTLLKSKEKIDHYYDPDTSRSTHMRHWVNSKEKIRRVARSRLRLGEKIGITNLIFLYMIRSRRKIFLELINAIYGRLLKT